MNPARGISWAGLALGPLAWALSTQLNYILPSWQCGRHAYPVPWIALILAILSVAGAWLSFLAFRNMEVSPADLPRKPRTERFVSLVGAGSGALFALGILLQGFAGIVFIGCER